MIQCPAGSYSNTDGASNCHFCPAGRYNDATGASACRACTGLEYQDLEGQIKCRTCPQGQYWLSDLSTVIESDGQCEECPLGATCSPVDGIVPYPNYFIYTDADRLVQARVCLPGFCETCTNQSFARSEALVPGQVFSCCSPQSSNNPLCGRCDDDYYLSDGDCICTSTLNAPPCCCLVVEMNCILCVVEIRD